MSDVVLVLTSPHMTGSVVKGCQKDINTRLDAWKVPKSAHLKVDGDWGSKSRSMAASVLYGLGVDKGGDYDGVSASDRLKIRHGVEKLTAAEKKLHTARKDWRERFAARFEDDAGPLAALEYARAHIGVTEKPAGSNTGAQIDKWEAACGIHAAPWCGCFVNACLVAAGLPNEPWLMYCPSIEAKARAGVDGWSWHSAPAIGDLVLYGAREAVHVGIVEEVVASGRDTSTIEGNTSNGPGGSQSNGGVVARRHRHSDGSLNGFPIRGYARPPYKR